MVMTRQEIMERHLANKLHHQKHAHYANYIKNNPLNKTQYQRFCPHVLLYCILNAIAKHDNKNYIATNLGNRNKIYRGANKMRRLFNKQHKLLPHADGKFYNIWFVGNKNLIKDDHKSARIKGPKHYYMPGYYITFAIALAQDICHALADFYDKCLEFSKTRNRFMKHIIINVDPLRKHKNVTPRFIDDVMKSLLDFSKAGYREHLQGDSFGHKVGRPGYKLHAHRGTYNPRLFMKFIKSEEGQNMIDDFISDISRGKHYFSRHRRKNCYIKAKVMCLIFDTDASDKFRVALREAVWSGELKDCKDKLALILRLLPPRVSLYWDDANRLEKNNLFDRKYKALKKQEKPFNLYASNVHNYVHNSKKEQLNTEHYTYSNSITHKVNKTSDQRLPDLSFLREYLDPSVKIPDKFLTFTDKEEGYGLKGGMDFVERLMLKAREQDKKGNDSIHLSGNSG